MCSIWSWTTASALLRPPGTGGPIAPVAPLAPTTPVAPLAPVLPRAPTTPCFPTVRMVLVVQGRHVRLAGLDSWTSILLGVASARGPLAIFDAMVRLWPIAPCETVRFSLQGGLEGDIVAHLNAPSQQRKKWADEPC